MNGFSWKKIALFGLVVIGIAWAAFGLRPGEMTPERVRTYVISFGVWAPVIYLLIYGQPIVPLPASIMMMTGGLAFGPLWGTLAALCGATSRACGQLFIARHLGRDAIARRLKGKVASLDRRIGENGFKAVFLIRLIPNVPSDIQNYTLGMSKVKFVPYVLATFLGLIPWAFAFGYLGYSLTDLRQVWKFLAGLLFLLILIAAQHRFSRRSS